MPKKIETEKQRLFCHVFIISVILIAENAGPLVPPLATPMSERLVPATVPHGKSGPGYCITFT